MTSAAYVASLSTRVAHVTHALLTTVTELGGPAKAKEIVIYDREAMSTRSTGAALVAAQREGLAAGTRGIWIPTPKAHCHRQALEDRFLEDEDRRNS